MTSLVGTGRSDADMLRLTSEFRAEFEDTLIMRRGSLYGRPRKRATPPPQRREAEHSDRG